MAERSGEYSGRITIKTQKIDRKENRLPKICKICSQCEDRTICDNRVGTKKCKKCLDCKGKDILCLFSTYGFIICKRWKKKEDI